MSDVVIGAILGLAASLITTIILKILEWRREDSVRWDKDILSSATEALIAAERAIGRIYAWSYGEYVSPPGRGRPDEVDSTIDSAYYRMKSLVILLPEAEAHVEELQAILIALANLTGAVGESPAVASLEYKMESERLRANAADTGNRILDCVQERLRVDRSR